MTEGAKDMSAWCIALICSATWAAAPPEASQPVIDVHRHASWPGEDDAGPRAELLAQMNSENVVLTLLSINEPSDEQTWLDAAPGRFLGGPVMPCNVQVPRPPFYRCFPDTKGWPDLAWLERELTQGRIGFLGEMLFVYFGVPPDDARMRPYWKLAAKYDVPVSVHVNRGPPPGVGPRRDPRCCPAFNSELGNPALLRPVLRRHPKLRILIQHVGAGAAPDHLPFTAETMALLRDYQSVYVDLSILNDAGAGDRHEAELKRLIDAGFGDRIMFGSDTRPIGPILRRMEKIRWLSKQQRRAILYNNAARFLRLDQKTIQNHHGR